MNYTRVMSALRRRRWWILSAVTACTLATGYGATRMPREYAATAQVMPGEAALGTLKELETPLEVAQDKDDLVGRQDRLKTVAAVLTSPTVIGRVIEQQRLNTTPAKLLEEISVEEVTSQMLRISVKDKEAARASAIVNGIVDEFVRYYTDLRSQEARKQLALVDSERRKAEKELRLASASLHGFKKSGQISSLEDQTKALLEQSGLLSDERNKAEARLREVSAQFESVSESLNRAAPTKEIREASTNALLLDKLRGEVVDLKRALDKELGLHTEEHPNVKRLQNELAEAQTRLATESTSKHETVRVIPNPERETLLVTRRQLMNERDGLMARVASLNNDLGRLQARVSSLSGKDVELSVLAQRYAQAQQRQAALTNRAGQLRNVAASLSNGTPIQVVDRADQHNPPQDLSVGRTLRLTALALVMSLAMCVALAIAMETADRRVRTLEDAEELAHLPVVSVVPQLAGRASAGTLCLTAENDPDSHLAESYHFLANHVLRQTFSRESTVLMGATGRPGQGATTALSNLAIALARAGRQVVLVEADMRRPFLHEVFCREEKPGLSDVLQRTATVQDALAPTHVENLRLLSAGTKVKDPWSLLWQPYMADVVQQLREEATYVIFNVPSATVFADALGIAPHVDGAILVMRTKEMPNGAELKVQSWLDEVNVPVMGLVLNGVPAKDMDTAEFHRDYAKPRRGETPAAMPALGDGVTAPVRRSA